MSERQSTENDVATLLREAYRRGYEDRSKERDFDPGHALDLVPSVSDRIAQAWDEGEQAGRDNADDGYPDPTVENPYRAPFRPEGTSDERAE